MYDLRTDAWTKETDMPTPRAYLATPVMGGKIYAIGGIPVFAGGNNSFATVEVYDTGFIDFPFLREASWQRRGAQLSASYRV
jgi:hypothetical protein